MSAEEWLAELKENRTEIDEKSCTVSIGEYITLIHQFPWLSNHQPAHEAYP